MNTSPPKKNKQIDAALLKAVHSGDQHAFEMVYLHYFSPVRNFLTTLVRSEEMGDELAQDVFVTLWTRRENIDPHKNISGYLYTIAKNLAFKYLAKRVGAPLRELSLVDQHKGSVAPDEAYIASELELLVEIAISRMPARRREVFMLSRKEGLSNSEIAARLELSKNTVENHVTSALNDLKKVLGMLPFLAFVLLSYFS